MSRCPHCHQKTTHPGDLVGALLRGGFVLAALLMVWMLARFIL